MNEKDHPSPEQLLKMLDAQMETSRQLRAHRGERRSSMRVLSIGIILFVMMVALWALMMVLEQMRPAKPETGPGALPEQMR
jgi:hypothetical protein